MLRKTSLKCIKPKQNVYIKLCRYVLLFKKDFVLFLYEKEWEYTEKKSATLGKK